MGNSTKPVTGPDGDNPITDEQITALRGNGNYPSDLVHHAWAALGAGPLEGGVPALASHPEDCRPRRVRRRLELPPRRWVMAGVTRYRRATHTRRLNKMKLPKMPKRKICFRCQRDGLRHSRVERFFARWTCRSCGAVCCEHLCGYKDDDKATCGPCCTESSKLAPRKTGGG